MKSRRPQASIKEDLPIKTMIITISKGLKTMGIALDTGLQLKFCSASGQSEERVQSEDFNYDKSYLKVARQSKFVIYEKKQTRLWKNCTF